MKILFIDIDGPLVADKMAYLDHYNVPKELQGFEHLKMFDPFAVRFLNMIFEQNDDLYGVLHTTWRKFYDDDIMKSVFSTQGCQVQWHDDMCCPFGWNTLRWEEINEWLDNHPDIDHNSFCVLDDDIPLPNDITYMPWLSTNLVVVDAVNGLSKQNVIDVMETLELRKSK